MHAMLLVFVLLLKFTAARDVRGRSRWETVIKTSLLLLLPPPPSHLCRECRLGANIEANVSHVFNILKENGTFYPMT